MPSATSSSAPVSSSAPTITNRPIRKNSVSHSIEAIVPCSDWRETSSITAAPGERDRRRLEVQRLVDEEHEDRQRRRIGTVRARLGGVLDRLARRRAPSPARAPSGAICSRERNARYSPGITTTSVTTTIGARLAMNAPNDSPVWPGDQDVRRVADQRRGAADVRRDDLDR